MERPQENRRLDYLPKLKLPLWQRKDMFCMNTDTVLLGEQMVVKSGESVLDLGCNNGALLLYASRFSPASLTGVDLFPEALALAEENMQINGLEAELICADLAEFRHLPFDVIVCNPPYFKTPDTDSINKNSFLAAARHEASCTLETLFAAGGHLLKDKGRFYMVHRADRLAEIIAALSESPLTLREATLVFDHRTHQASAVILELRKGKLGPVRFREPLWRPENVESSAENAGLQQ